jgi:hypothetical protein
MRSETSGTLREKLAQLSDEERSVVALEARDAVREYFSYDQMSFPARILIVTGTKQM